MPQFDFFCFSVQVFWTLFTFFLFYLFFISSLLPKTGELFKIRSKLLSITISQKNFIKFYSACFY